MLSTNQPTRIKGLYITDTGSIGMYDLMVDYYVDADDFDDKPLWLKMLADLQQHILILRGMSKFTTFTDRNLKTPLFDIQYDASRLRPWTLETPCFGSLRECIEMNVKSMASVTMSNARINYRSVYAKVTDNTQYISVTDDNIFLNLILVSDYGITYNRYKLLYEFSQDRNPECTTCISGMNAFKINISQFGTTPINVDGTSHTVDGQIITDIKVDTEDRIIQVIKTTLAPTIAMAKLINLRLESV